MELTENQKAWLGTVYDEAIREHRAAADNGTILPRFGRRMNPSRTCTNSDSGPEWIIVCSGSYTFAVCDSA